MSDTNVQRTPVVISAEARQIFDNLDWASVEQSIRNNVVKIKQTSQELGVTPAELRAELVNRYGDRISFVRGRTGGVRLSN
jgi:hypothetical protein